MIEVIEAAGFVDVRFGAETYDTFSGAPSASSAVAYGTRGVNLTGRKPGRKGGD